MYHSEKSLDIVKKNRVYETKIHHLELKSIYKKADRTEKVKVNTKNNPNMNKNVTATKCVQTGRHT